MFGSGDNPKYRIGNIIVRPTCVRYAYQTMARASADGSNEAWRQISGYTNLAPVYTSEKLAHPLKEQKKNYKPKVLAVVLHFTK